MALPRVLITRSAHQASALAEALSALGAEPVLLPVIELTEPTSFAALDESLTRLDVFDWVVFTSANAVEIFAKRAGSRLGLAQKIAVIGPATAGAIEAAGLRVDLMPSKAEAESLVEALQPFTYQYDGRASRFLVIRAEVAREYLPEALRAFGAEVMIAPAYRNVIPAGSVLTVRELFRSRDTWPDGIIFTSSSSVTNLLALLEVAGLGLPVEVLRASIGPVTSRTLEVAGYPPHVEAEASKIAELAKAMMKALAARG